MVVFGFVDSRILSDHKYRQYAATNMASGNTAFRDRNYEVSK